MLPIVIDFPAEASDLMLYYALQENSMPCEVTSLPHGRLKITPVLVGSAPEDHRAECLIFIKGWIAGWKREPEPYDGRIAVGFRG